MRHRDPCSVVSGLVAMNEHPNIRYSQSSPPAYIKMLATTIHKYMAAYRRSNPEWMPYGHQSVRLPRPTHRNALPAFG